MHAAKELISVIATRTTPGHQIDKHGKYRPDPRTLTKSLRDLRPAVARSPEVRFALRCYAAYHRGDWAAFFALATGPEAGYMEACLLHKYFGSVRSRALRVLHAAAHRGAAVPLPALCSALRATEAEMLELCEHHGATLQEEADGARSLFFSFFPFLHSHPVYCDSQVSS